MQNSDQSQAGASGTESGYLTDLSGHWAERSITALVSRQLVSGDPDGRFRPDDPVNRAEFCSVLCRLLELPQDAAAAAVFGDVQAHWAAGYIGAMKSAGIAGGTGTGVFLPEGGLTREELVTMLAKGLQLVPESGDELDFTDGGLVSAWAKNALIAASKAGYIGGYPDGSFRPGETVSRAEMSVVMEKVLQARDAQTAQKEKK